MERPTQSTAIIAQRVNDYQTPNTKEIEHLTQSTNCEIHSTITQQRESDPEFEIGEGKATEIKNIIQNSEVDTVIFDARLTPYQTYNLGVKFPNNITILDRYLLVLQLLRQQADSKREQQQLELARLRYELPRMDAKTSLAKRDEKPPCMNLDGYDEAYTTYIKNRISKLSSDLESLENTYEKRQQQRREDNNHLVTIFGYTNSGKSKLFKRLSNTLTTQPEDTQTDLHDTSPSTNELLTTFSPITRRMQHDTRDVLLTDTMGVVSDIPFWVYDSLSPALHPIRTSNLILLVADITDPIPSIREKIVTAQDQLPEDANTLIVLNKTDKLSATECEEKVDALSVLAPNPICVSAETGTGIQELKDNIELLLPQLQRERLQLPMTDDTMSVVSWIYDNANVKYKEFNDDGVFIDFTAENSVVQQARSKATALTNIPSN